MKGSIYMITTSKADICYIGSTATTVAKRWQVHNDKYRQWLSMDKKSISIFPYMKEHGLETFKIQLLKEYVVVDNKELLALEQLWINKYKRTAVNKNCAFQCMGKQAIKAKSSEYQRTHREKHKDELNEKAKAYRRANKDKLSEYKEANKARANEYSKEYRQANKDKAKEYYQANKDKLKEKSKEKREADKVECGCGSTYQRAGKTSHQGSKKHSDWIASQL